MSRIGFVGYYGMRNYGDDLFAVTSLLAARKYWAEDEAKVLGAGDIEDSRRTGNSPGQRPGVLGAIVRAGVLGAGSASIDRLVFAGGSLFHANSSRVLDLVRMGVQARRKPVSAIGVSIGPFSGVAEARRVKKQLQQFEFVAVRDRTSLQIAREFGLSGAVAYSADLAFLYSDLAPKHVQNFNGSRIVGFSPCALERDEAKAIRYCETFVESMARLRRVEDYHACLVNLNENPRLGDGFLCKWTESKLREAGIPVSAVSYGTLGVHGTWRLISTFAGYVSVRLHGAISAAATGVPFALLEYHRKCTDFLEEIGFPQALRIDGAGAVDLEAMIHGASHLPKMQVLSRRAQCNFTEAPWIS